MAVIRCTRCGFPAPIEPDEVTGDGGGDPSLLVVVVPPDGWIGDPEDDHGGICHCDCASPHEIEEWMAQNAQIERSLGDQDDDAE